MVYVKSKKIIILAVVFFIAIAGITVYKTGRTITVIGNNEGELWRATIEDFPAFPEPEENRIDMLILGIRGFTDDDDMRDGGNKGEYLADTIILASFNKESKQAALVSIPRDFYVDIPQHGKERINSAYAIGETRQYGGGGLALTKALVSVVSGVYVDYAASVDFMGFEKLIDYLGGIVIYRDTPFVEEKQWVYDGREGERYWRLQDQTTTTSAGWIFYVPKGQNTMNSKEALYYARSRYASSDFDRMRRQQEVISSVKSKLLNLGVLANPIKVFNILDILENNVRSDMTLTQMKELVELAQRAKMQDFKKAVLSSEKGGLLREDILEGKFVLLPQSGDYTQIQELFKTIVD